ncbi:MAG: FAD-binding protein [Chlamydiae bacterium]|nr:FAD-binding protein [Chlamydiota bacterium]
MLIDKKEDRNYNYRIMNILHPIESTARGIENIVIAGKETKSYTVAFGCFILSRTISITVFPLFLTIELIFKRIPKLICAFGDLSKFKKRFEKLTKVAIGILATPLSLKAPEGVTGLFLKTRWEKGEVRPFGVEQEYGKSGLNICIPKTDEELEEIVEKARADKKQISILGSRMSQGTQTIPFDESQIVVDMSYFKSIEMSTSDNTVLVGAGSTWEELQIELNKVKKSCLVKQASDPFSIGGSIGINCHGWAHELGSISSTVVSLDVLDAEGKIRTIDRADPLFRCMFGTLGYFGIVVRARLRITDNTTVIQKTDEITIGDFATYYKTRIKGKNIPLFGGRLSLDSVDGPPLRSVCMVRYEEASTKAPTTTPNFSKEPSIGTRIQRIGLRLFAHLSTFSVKRVLRWFWTKEKEEMFREQEMTRNEALHPPINSFRMLHDSNMHAQWLQEYFLTEDELPPFLEFLGKTLHENNVRLVNATIRPTPKDDISILPYAEKDRYAVVICFSQVKTKRKIEKTKAWIQKVQDYLLEHDGIYYQAYMPYASREEFEKTYGEDRVQALREEKERFDPTHLFGNSHTAKYFDRTEVTDTSTYRRVFQTSKEMQNAFVKFLCTIFYQLDEKKVLEEMEKILANSSLTDAEIYKALLSKIDVMKKPFLLLLKIKALNVLKKQMGVQAKALLKKFDKTRFHDYMEIYDRRYLTDIRKAAGLPLDGETIGLTDSRDSGFKGRLEAGTLLSRYPYKKWTSLNDRDCRDPAKEVEKTYRPLGPDVKRESLDLVACLGGLHHIPKERVAPFLASLASKMRPGAPILLRDHDVTGLKEDDLRAIVSVVHSFVNAADGVSPEIEQAEIREFKSLSAWTDKMNEAGFTRVSPEKGLVIQDDPTENGMMLFVKAPQNLKELREAAKYRAHAIRPVDGTRATWIEWGNVRFSKSYAEFIQTHHAYAFDYIGHIKQHFTHFKEYMKGKSFIEALKADNLAMNLFILISTTVTCALSYIAALPSMAVARIKDGVNWRNATDLTRLERADAEIEDEYSKFIDIDPFYKFPYLSKIKTLWRATTFSTCIPAIISTINLVAKAIISAPIRAFYTGETNLEPSTVSMIVHDPENELAGIDDSIEVIYTTPDHHKLITVPRYRPFTKICGRLAKAHHLKMVDIGGHEKITVDLLLPRSKELSSSLKGIRPIYSLKRLQDPKQRHYTTCEVDVSKLKFLLNNIPEDLVDYIHE